MSEGQLLLPLEQIHAAADNPRREIGDVAELAASIAAVGIIEPIVVCPAEDGYTIIAGARRAAAAAKAGLDEVPVVVRPGLTDDQRLELMLIENLQREDLAPIEEALAYQRLIELGHTQRQLASRIGRNQSHVSKRLALLKLPAPALEALDAGGITIEQAVSLTKLPTKTVEKLVDRRGEVSSWSIENAILTQERDEAIARATAKLKADGVPVIKHLTTYSMQAVPQAVGRWGPLGDLDPAEHAACPGNAASVTAYGNRVEVLTWCSQPELHPEFAKAQKGDARSRRLTKAEREELARREQLDADRKRRRDFVLHLPIAKLVKEPAAMDVLAMAILVDDSIWPDDQPDVATLLNLPGDGDTDPAPTEWAGEDPVRIRRVALAAALVCLDGSAGWFNGRELAIWPFWFGYLQDHGYEISDVEQDEYLSLDEDEPESEVRRCKACGCTDEEACEPDGCTWVADDLCSACVDVSAEPAVEGEPDPFEALERMGAPA